ncbi:HAD-like domain-containing protein [Lineolata rhizophorae]|uniref:HAD-like domain-containing protein n=1 Tax=Lineolata rhizophorae TaxID=578093 RepID=A0A6A6NRY2_9PEZI|nr:HAD-like domain-containing protein [Lineolata rhizophorae]
MLGGLQQKLDLTLTPEETDAYVERELGKVIETLEKKGEPCPGALQVLSDLHKEGKYGLAVVSSSALSRVQASIKKVGMDFFFPPNHIYSAATSLPKPTSKPNPAIYLHACEDIGVAPADCVAVEDSRSGALAAKNAGIRLIGYVGPYDEDEKEHMRKVLKEECGAVVVMEHWEEFRECMAKVEAV